MTTDAGQPDTRVVEALDPAPFGLSGGSRDRPGVEGRDRSSGKGAHGESCLGPLHRGNPIDADDLLTLLWAAEFERIQYFELIQYKVAELRLVDVQDKLATQTTDKSLILGTWNIRNFDVIAIQELTRDLAPLDRLMGVLGPEYRYIVTDVTEGRPGNTERLGVIYNRRKVRFRGMAGEVVLPERLLITDVTERRQFSRTPFACSFESGWFRFVMATVHIYFGSKGKSTSQYARRVAEIESVARFLSKRSRDEEETYVLVGDVDIDFTEDYLDRLIS